MANQFEFTFQIRNRIVDERKKRRYFDSKIKERNEGTFPNRYQFFKDNISTKVNGILYDKFLLINNIETL
jgi:hypothetical protein